METGWLIDNGLLCIGVGNCGFRKVTYTDPRAIRFARKEDAINCLAAFKRMGWSTDDFKAIGHQWVK